MLEANKPPTRAGKKLSIMGFRTLPDGSYRAPPLAVGERTSPVVREVA
jgi:hypothetical protein